MKAISTILLILFFCSCSDGVRVKSFTWEELGEPNSDEMADQASYRRENISYQSGNTVIMETYMIAPMSTKWKAEIDVEDDTLFYSEKPKDPVKKLEKYKFTWVIETRKRESKTYVFRHIF